MTGATRPPTLRRLLAVVVMAIAGLGGAPVTPAHSRQATGSVEGLVAQARDLTRAYDYESALELVEEATAIDPFDLGANTLLRTLYSRLERYGLLEARYRELVVSHPENATAYYLLGGAARSPQAREAYLRLALRLDPNHAAAALELARRSRDRPAAAETLYRRALALEPGNYLMASGYASFLRRHDRDAEAISFLQQMVARYPHELRFLTALWNIQRRQGEAAMQRLLPQIRAQQYRFMGSHEHMEMLANFWEFARSEGRPYAFELWQQIAEKYPDHPRAEVALLRALNLADGAEDKKAVLRTLDERYPGSPARYAAYYSILRNLIADERNDEAIELARSLLTLPDPGYDPRGAGRDARIAGMAVFGNTLECIGYAGWFAAGQAPVARTGVPVDWFGGRRPIRDLDAEAVVLPEAATAARQLVGSGCESANVLFGIGLYLAQSSSYRTLGIEILERALTVHRDTPPHELMRNAPLQPMPLDHYRELLAYYYLQDGLAENAVAMVDRLLAQGSRRSSRFYRIAGQVYETVGRPEDAKRAYLRGLSSSSDREFVRAALDRLYDQLTDTEIVLFDRAGAPLIPLRATRVARVHLGIDAPLHRFVGDDLTLVVLWFPRTETGRGFATTLPELGRLLGAYPLTTLSIAVDLNTGSGARAVSRLSFENDDARGVTMGWDALAAWGIEELPVTLLIDADGRVLAQQMSYGVGLADWLRDWRATIEQYGRGNRRSPLRRPADPAGRR